MEYEGLEGILLHSSSNLAKSMSISLILDVLQKPIEGIAMNLSFFVLSQSLHMSTLLLCLTRADLCRRHI